MEDHLDIIVVHGAPRLEEATFPLASHDLSLSLANRVRGQGSSSCRLSDKNLNDML